MFVAVACLSVVFDARYLNQTLEFDTAIKKLTLLLSYALAVRDRREQRPAQPRCRPS